MEGGANIEENNFPFSFISFCPWDIYVILIEHFISLCGELKCYSKVGLLKGVDLKMETKRQRAANNIWLGRHVCGHRRNFVFVKPVKVTII